MPPEARRARRAKNGKAAGEGLSGTFRLFLKAQRVAFQGIDGHSGVENCFVVGETVAKNKQLLCFCCCGIKRRESGSTVQQNAALLRVS